jgi:hypothetical protein
MALMGLLALVDAEILLLEMVLLSFPVVPVVVLKKTTPLEVLVSAPSMLQY